MADRKACVVVQSARQPEAKGWLFLVEMIEADGCSAIMWDGRSYRAAMVAARELERDGAGPVVDRVMA